MLDGDPFPLTGGILVSSRDVTGLLRERSRGNGSAFNQLLPLVYSERRRIGARQLRRERAVEWTQAATRGPGATASDALGWTPHQSV